jgi:hypothetical protein
MSRLLLSSVIVATSLAVMAPAPASAQTYDKLAYLTFSGAVQIPGATLNAGTYRFHLSNPGTSRNVLQVLSYDGGTVYGMFHTIPEFRAVVTSDPVVRFKEAPADVPPPVHSLFYGGESLGYEFVYPKGGPNMIAAVRPQPEITYSAAPAAAAPPAVPEPAPVRAPAVEVAPEPVTSAAPVEMPRTATNMPLVAAGGLTLLILGLGVGFLRRAG